MPFSPQIKARDVLQAVANAYITGLSTEQLTEELKPLGVAPTIGGSAFLRAQCAGQKNKSATPRPPHVLLEISLAGVRAVRVRFWAHGVQAAAV